MKSLRWIFLALIGLCLIGSAADDASASRRHRRAPRCSEEVKSCRQTNDTDYCMTCNAVREALNQGFEGMVYVNQTVIARTRSGQYPENICATIYQRSQFSWTRSPRTCVSEDDWDLAKKSVKEARRRGSNAKLFYHANYVRPRWSRRCVGRRQVGVHIFYGMCGSAQALAHFKRETLPRITSTSANRSQAVTAAVIPSSMDTRPDLPNGAAR